VTVTVEVGWVDERLEALPVRTPDEVVRVEHVAKLFGEVVALRDVCLHLRRGESLGLIGDNASGKSTLIKIVAGFHRPDAGRLLVDGEPVALTGVGHARALGIDCVFQDLAVIDQLSVWENIVLRRETVHRPLPLLARRRMRAHARAALDDLGIHISSVDVPAGHLSGGQRQALAVARSIRSGARILLLDEPIAAMGAKEGAAVLDVIARLREETSISIVVVAHNFAHVMEVCDRVNLIEDGAITLDTPASRTSAAELAGRMLASAQTR
jgi:simple sugar transport system ATP-binding protein